MKSSQITFVLVLLYLPRCNIIVTLMPSVRFCDFVRHTLSSVLAWIGDPPAKPLSERPLNLRHTFIIEWKQFWTHITENWQFYSNKYINTIDCCKLLVFFLKNGIRQENRVYAFLIIRGVLKPILPKQSFYYLFKAYIEIKLWKTHKFHFRWLIQLDFDRTTVRARLLSKTCTVY